MRETQKIPYFFSISFLVEALTPGKLSTVSSVEGLKDLSVNKFVFASADLHQVLSSVAERGLSDDEVRLGESVKEVSMRSVNNPRIGTNVSLGYAILSISLVYVLTSVIRLGFDLSISNLGLGHSILKESLTREAAENLYESIRMAGERHLGKFFGKIPDINEEPKGVNVWEVLKASSADDSIAYEVVNGFPKTYEACKRIKYYVGMRGMSVLEAVRETQIDLLSKYPDTLVMKAFGQNTAYMLKELVNIGRAEKLDLKVLDKFLRNLGVNPGATSDILSAGLGLYLVMSYEGTNR